MEMPGGEHGEQGKRGRLADIAYEHVKRQLVEGKFQPGAALAIKPLAEMLEMSRQPVMEALKKLAGEGFVEILPQIGCRVAVTDHQDIADFFRMFAMAEALCAECAATRRTDADLETLAGASAAIGTLGALGSEKGSTNKIATRYRLLNRDFHRALHAMAHSATIAEIARGLWDRADFYIGTTLGTALFATRLDDAFREHEAIYAAIKKGDAATARHLMETHVLAFGAEAEAAGTKT